MNFFSSGPGPRRPARPMRRGGTRDNWIPGAVADPIVIARNEQAAVFVSAITCLDTGFEVILNVVVRDGDPGETYRALLESRLRFGVEYADGARGAFATAGELAGGVRLLAIGGSGNDFAYRQSIWISPLPPPGPVTFHVSWPEQSLPESAAHVAGQLLLDAAKRAVQLWPEDNSPPEVDFSSAPPLPPAGTAPDDPDSAREQIRDAFAIALDSDPDGRDALVAVQDGPALAGALAHARSTFPMETSTSQVVVGDIVFIDERRAALVFQMFWSSSSLFGPQLGYAVYERGEWKVSRDTYCRVLSWTGAICPPPPPT